MYTVVYSKLCENTKNYKYAYPGSNKVVYGACEQDSEIICTILHIEKSRKLN